MATKKEMIDTVKVLLDRGADISSRDKVFLMINLIIVIVHIEYINNSFL